MTERIENIKIKDLVPFENHPFKTRSGIEQEELSESIKSGGLLTPIIARPFSDGKYEIISENLWLRVQELRKNKRRNTATGRKSLFLGLVYCADCGSKLHFCAAKSLKKNH